MTPWLWNRYVDLFGARGGPAPRPHQDGNLITPESPEAFEEPIWHREFPTSHRLAEDHVLRAADRVESFDRVFLDHIRKMLLVRGGRRYASKGNYNLTRIEYLASLFPDSRFVVPIRHPVPHVGSLVRQHELFCRYSERDGRVPHYLRAAGHFEFGPQRVPISVSGSGGRTVACWERGEEHRGYAIQWAAVYGHVLGLLRSRPSLADRVLVVRYEDICEAPREAIAGVLRHAGLFDEGAAMLDDLGHIRGAAPGRDRLGPTSEVIWEEAGEVASAFGYEYEPIDRPVPLRAAEAG
jgi:hypothetical protein